MTLELLLRWPQISLNFKPLAPFFFWSWDGGQVYSLQKGTLKRLNIDQRIRFSKEMQFGGRAIRSKSSALPHVCGNAIRARLYHLFSFPWIAIWNGDKSFDTDKINGDLYTILTSWETKISRSTLLADIYRCHEHLCPRTSWQNTFIVLPNEGDHAWAFLELANTLASKQLLS